MSVFASVNQLSESDEETYVFGQTSPKAKPKSKPKPSPTATEKREVEAKKKPAAKKQPKEKREEIEPKASESKSAAEVAPDPVSKAQPKKVLPKKKPASALKRPAASSEAAAASGGLGPEVPDGGDEVQGLADVRASHLFVCDFFAGPRKVSSVYYYGATNKFACKLNGSQAFQARLAVHKVVDPTLTLPDGTFTLNPVWLEVGGADLDTEKCREIAVRASHI